MTDGDRSISDLAEKPPGFDPDDPYTDMDIDELPEWWRRAIEEHEQYELRPYRPPKFSDGKITRQIIRNLEGKFNVDIDIIDYYKHDESIWTVLVNKDPVMDIGRTRRPEGYTKYEISSGKFIEAIWEHVEKNDMVKE
jgi:hypothetical protein